MVTGRRCNLFSVSISVITMLIVISLYSISTKIRSKAIRFRHTDENPRNRLKKIEFRREKYPDLPIDKMPAGIDFKQRFLDYAYQDLLHMTPPTYLPEFKNPCWYENKNTSVRTLRCLPFFMLLGQNKCGTSDLYNSILAHPDVIPARDKEPQFWARHRHCYCCGKLTYRFRCRKNKPWTWKQYVNFFNPTANKIKTLSASTFQQDYIQSTEIITGEASPSNLWDNRWWWNYEVNQYDTEPPALTNAHYLRHFLPDLKMIIILRNPVARLYSDYRYISTGITSPENFHQKVLGEISAFRDCSRHHDSRYCVYHNSFNESDVSSTVRLHNGFYALFIEEYMKFFPRDQFHILRLQDYSANKAEEMKKIFLFLNLRDVEVPHVNTRRNKGRKNTRAMLPETRSILTKFYQPYTDHLADLLGDEKFLWLE